MEGEGERPLSGLGVLRRVDCGAQPGVLHPIGIGLQRPGRHGDPLRQVGTIPFLPLADLRDPGVDTRGLRALLDGVAEALVDVHFVPLLFLLVLAAALVGDARSARADEGGAHGKASRGAGGHGPGLYVAVGFAALLGLLQDGLGDDYLRLTRIHVGILGDFHDSGVRGFLRFLGILDIDVDAQGKTRGSAVLHDPRDDHFKVIARSDAAIGCITVLGDVERDGSRAAIGGGKGIV